jgi:hypothetical protein
MDTCIESSIFLPCRAMLHQQLVEGQQLWPVSASSVPVVTVSRCSALISTNGWCYAAPAGLC